MSSSDLSGKDKLIRAAEQLFAEKGIEATSLREVGTLAEQKNTNAVQYHFGGKEGLIRAIWQRHAQDVEQYRIKMLAALDEQPSLQSLVEAIIFPIADKINDEDGGKYYIQIMSQLVSYSGASLLELFQHTPDKTTQSIMNAIKPYVAHLSEADKVSRTLFVAGVIFHGLADYIRLSNTHSPLMRNLQATDLIKNLVCVVTAAISAE